MKDSWRHLQAFSRNITNKEPRKRTQATKNKTSPATFAARYIHVFPLLLIRSQDTADGIFCVQVSQWLGILQAIVMVPVMLRLLRRRYKMPWTCFLHSQLYLVVQAVDLAAIVSLAAGTDDRALRLTAEVSVYLASVYLCVCCMALATPPVYIGQRIVRR